MLLRILRNGHGRLSVFPLLFLMNAWVQPAEAAVQLQKVKVVNPSQIDLAFDSAVKESDVKIEFINDIIQLTFEDANVYPAKISSVNGGDILKVFAYQYSPKVVRTRFTVKGNAADFEGRFKMKASGKNLSLRMVEGKVKAETPSRANEEESESQERLTLSSDRAVAPSELKPSGRRTDSENSENNQEMQAEEKRLLDRVVAATQNSEPEKSSEKVANQNSNSKKKETSVSVSSSGFSMQNYLFKVVLLISSMALFLVGVLFVFKALSKKKSGVAIASHKNFNSLLDRLGGVSAGLGLGTGGKKKWIEVVANHHLGPKRSIAVVKIGQRQLVLGVTQESINLITDLGVHSSDQAVSEAVGKAVLKGNLSSHSEDFSDVLEDLAQESVLPQRSAAPQAGAQRRAAGASAYDQKPAPSVARSEPAPFASESARARIRSKLEGLKQL
jgi:flagellar biogenesis protein FliO